MKKKMVFVLLFVAVLSFACAADSFAQRWSFDSRDAEGTWYVHNYMVTPEWTGWAFGYVNFDGTGKIIGGTLTTHDGYGIRILGGRYVIKSSGHFVGTMYGMEHSRNPISITVKGTMNMGKDTITTVDMNSYNTPSLTILVKSPEKPPYGTMAR